MIFLETPGQCGQPVFRPQSYYIGDWCFTVVLILFELLFNGSFDVNWWIWLIIICVHVVLIVYTDYGADKKLLPLQIQLVLQTWVGWMYDCFIGAYCILGGFIFDGCSDTGKWLYFFLGVICIPLLLMIAP